LTIPSAAVATPEAAAAPLKSPTEIFPSSWFAAEDGGRISREEKTKSDREIVLTRRRGLIFLSLFIHFFDEFLKFWFLVRRQNFANLISPALTNLIQFRVVLFVQGLVLGVHPRQDRVQLLPLIARKPKIPGHLLDAPRTPLRLARRRIRG